MAQVVGGVDQVQHDIRAADRVPGAVDANALDFIGGVLAQAGGVDDMQRDAVDLDGLAHAVARGAGDGRDDGQLRAGQRVQQRRLAHVGLARQHHRQALAQQRALARLRQHAAKFSADGGKLAAGVGLLQEIDLFFGEVQRGFHQHAQVDDPIHKLADSVGELALHRTRR
ncbi:hypothetical protein D9M72_509130 [compost metagenome]